MHKAACGRTFPRLQLAKKHSTQCPACQAFLTPAKQVRSRSQVRDTDPVDDEDNVDITELVTPLSERYNQAAAAAAAAISSRTTPSAAHPTSSNKQPTTLAGRRNSNQCVEVDEYRPSAAKVLSWLSPTKMNSKGALMGTDIAEVVALEKSQFTALLALKPKTPQLLTAFETTFRDSWIGAVYLLCTQWRLQQSTFHLAAGIALRAALLSPTGTQQKSKPPGKGQQHGSRDAFPVPKLAVPVCVMMATKLEEQSTVLDASDVGRIARVHADDACQAERILSEALSFRLQLVTSGSVLETLCLRVSAARADQQWAALLTDIAQFFPASFALQKSSVLLAAGAIFAGRCIVMAEQRALLAQHEVAKRLAEQHAKGKKAKPGTKQQRVPSKGVKVAFVDYPDEPPADLLALLAASVLTNYDDVVNTAQALISVVPSSFETCSRVWKRYSSAANGRLLARAANVKFVPSLIPADLEIPRPSTGSAKGRLTAPTVVAVKSQPATGRNQPTDASGTAKTKKPRGAAAGGKWKLVSGKAAPAKAKALKKASKKCRAR